MASRDAIILKRDAAMERIKRAMPGIRFDPNAFRGGSEFAHAADLESIADYAEGKTATKSKTTETDKE